ncbi:hypothetical protein EST38_g11645 [Candolleomyces aberdarensis]|uniref:Uncharacterized protein n=1 Tax=Candolleomyces aberdarensis TaxID=2316362 RepID=A0A4Q2D515_9AGAR|nr:hypothetical protein EST38_g11645 [Candolleomyces aberdarensis]
MHYLYSTFFIYTTRIHIHITSIKVDIHRADILALTHILRAHLYPRIGPYPAVQQQGKGKERERSVLGLRPDNISSASTSRTSASSSHHYYSRSEDDEEDLELDRDPDGWFVDTFATGEDTSSLLIFRERQRRRFLVKQARERERERERLRVLRREEEEAEAELVREKERALERERELTKKKKVQDANRKKRKKVDDTRDEDRETTTQKKKRKMAHVETDEVVMEDVAESSSSNSLLAPPSSTSNRSRGTTPTGEPYGSIFRGVLGNALHVPRAVFPSERDDEQTQGAKGKQKAHDEGDQEETDQKRQRQLSTSSTSTHHPKRRRTNSGIRPTGLPSASSKVPRGSPSSPFAQQRSSLNDNNNMDIEESTQPANSRYVTRSKVMDTSSLATADPSIMESRKRQALASQNRASVGVDASTSSDDLTSTPPPPPQLPVEDPVSVTYEDWEDLKEVWTRCLEVVDVEEPEDVLPLLRGIIHECSRFLQSGEDLSALILNGKTISVDPDSIASAATTTAATTNATTHIGGLTSSAGQSILGQSATKGLNMKEDWQMAITWGRTIVSLAEDLLERQQILEEKQKDIFSQHESESSSSRYSYPYLSTGSAEENPAAFLAEDFGVWNQGYFRGDRRGGDGVEVGWGGRVDVYGVGVWGVL